MALQKEEPGVSKGGATSKQSYGILQVIYEYQKIKSNL